MASVRPFLRRRATTLGIVVVLAATACSFDPATTPFVDGIQSTPASDAELQSYLAAVERTDDATRRSFTATVRVAVGDGVIEVLLAGSKDGMGRTLDVTTGADTVSYVVSETGATVDRGEGPVAVELSEVPSAPTLAALVDLGDPQIVGPGIIAGTIDAKSVLGETATADTVDVEVRWDDGGFVTGLEMRAPDGSFTALVAYRDIKG